MPDPHDPDASGGGEEPYVREKHNEIYVFAVNQRLTDAPYTPGFGKTYLLKKGWFVYARIQN